MKYLLIGFIKGWRLVISPLYGNVCKFQPLLLRVRPCGLFSAMARCEVVL